MPWHLWTFSRELFSSLFIMSVVVSSSFDFSFSIHPICYDYDACILKISADWLPVSFLRLLFSILPNHYSTTLILSLNFILLVHCIWWTVLLKNQSKMHHILLRLTAFVVARGMRYYYVVFDIIILSMQLSCNRCFAYITI